MSKFFVSIGNLMSRWLVWSVAALVPLGPIAVTHAGVASRVDATVTDQGDGTFLYEFTVHNTTPNANCEVCDLIVNWELPIFAITDLVDLTSVTSPEGWEFEIIELAVNPNASTTYYNNPNGPYGQYRWNWDPANDPTLDPTQGGDPAAYGPNPDVFVNPPILIHWFTTDVLAASPANPIFVGGSLNGFSFRSAFSQAPAPYQASWFQLPPTTGDPPIPNQPFFFGTPNSPERQAAQRGVVEAAFKVKRAEAEKEKRGVSFDIRGRFATDPALSDGINLPEDVTITLGSFSQTIPANAFVLEDRDDDGTFEFEGGVSGITRLSIDANGHVRIRGRRIDLGDVNFKTPVPFSLQIGDDLAETDVRFNRRHGREDHDRDRHGHHDHDRDHRGRD